MEATRTVSNKARWITLATVLSDLAIVVCLVIWVDVASRRYDYGVQRCQDLYEYYIDGDSDPCVDRDECNGDANCRLEEVETGSLISPSTDGDEQCPSGSCGSEGGCHCLVGGPLQGLFIAYVIFFGISMLMEIFKALSVISAAITESCDPAIYGPIETSPVIHCLDSWTLILLRIFYPKRYQQLIQANEEGRVPVATRLKMAQWACREFACGVTLTLYPFSVDYFNPCFVPYVVFLVIYLICLWARAQWVRTKNPNGQVAQPSQQQPQPVIAMMQLQQPQQTTMQFQQQPQQTMVQFQQPQQITMQFQQPQQQTTTRPF